MPFAVLVLIFKFTVGIARALARKMRTAKPLSICADCFLAHVQYGANARRSISCAYGGVVRPMKLDVLYCTDYRPRNVLIRTGSIGFVRAIAPVE